MKTQTKILIQYIVLRKDLSWGAGALAAQAAHASVAAIVSSFNEPQTQEYVANLTEMRKCVLSVDSKEALEVVAEKLRTAGLRYHLWTEQPENIPAALATAPGEKSELGPIFKGLKLFN